MAEADLETAGAPELMLDPFGYVVGVASRIAGLGGNAPGHDPTYVFHTPYVEAAQGPAHFTVQFANLRAKRGTLALRVHMLRQEEGAQLTLANSERITLNRLVAQGGQVSIRFEGFRNVSFALLARIPDESDVTADGVTVTLDRPAAPVDPDDVVIEAGATRYGSASLRPAAQLLAFERPRFAQPASQPATVAQTREREFAAWRQRLGASTSLLHDWQSAYVLQALERYGVLQEGAQGVGFDAVVSPIPAVLAGRGVDVLAVAHRIDSSALHAPVPRLAWRAADLADLPRDIVNRDLLWSIGVPGRLGSIGAALAFFEEAMVCLRPGGLAVHAFGYDLAGAHAHNQAGRVPPLARPDVERLALNLVSRGHEVAQLKLDDRKPLTAARGSARSAFGLIVRKGRAQF